MEKRPWLGFPFNLLAIAGHTITEICVSHLLKPKNAAVRLEGHTRENFNGDE